MGTPHQESGPELGREWLLANGLGGFAMGTACGVPTRRYHGLLVGAASPPVGRIVALHGVIDSIELPGGGEVPLANFLFRDDPMPNPDGWTKLLGFECDLNSAIWRWSLPSGIVITRTLTLRHGFNTCTIRWNIDTLPDVAVLRVRPLVLLRDFHSLQHLPSGIGMNRSGRTLRCTRDEYELTLRCSRGEWQGDPEWWHEFEYPMERARGYDHRESSLAASLVEVQLSTGQPWFELTAEMDAFVPHTPERVRYTKRSLPVRLAKAAEQFVVARAGTDTTTVGASIIAGYPWFSDWGRDTMISMRGLLLNTGRLDEARIVLETYASNIRDGLIPNRFDDVDPDAAHYNTADASLWFLHAVHAYIAHAGGVDRAPGATKLLAAAMTIIQLHIDGSCPGVRVADDGLIEAGMKGEALTWMDAQIDGVAVTPRIGKPVELSALWQSGLRLIASLVPAESPMLISHADAAAASFGLFWNESRGCCFDLLELQDGAWVGQEQIRPNQVFALSLPDCPLGKKQQQQVLDVITEHLLTPYGLRTLSQEDPEYRGRFDGDMKSRDMAYHNGTVWPWLIGPYCDALRSLATSSEEADAAVHAATASLVASLEHGCMGQVAEIYDGNPPHEPHGCPAQAWSVAELLRVLAPAATAVIKPLHTNKNCV